MSPTLIIALLLLAYPVYSASQSSFQAFITFVFTYYPEDPLRQETAGERSNNMLTPPEPMPDHPHPRYIPFNGVKQVKGFGTDPRDIMLQSPCNIHAEDITKQCLLKETNLFCYPHTRSCACFSWSALESSGHIQQLINEEDPLRLQLLHALGSYLRIEMAWNSDAHQCQSLNGSACFNPGKESLPQASHYVPCYPGLVCREALEDGMRISRCLPDQVASPK